MHAERLVPVEVLPLTHEHGTMTRLRSGTRLGTVTAKCVDGKVYILWGDQEEPERVDLNSIPHEFIS